MISIKIVPVRENGRVCWISTLIVKHGHLTLYQSIGHFPKLGVSEHYPLFEHVWSQGEWRT